MASLAKLVVELGFDGSDFESGINRVGGKLKSIGASLTTAITVPLLAAAGASVKYGSDLNEAMSAARTVFGDQGDAIIKWGDTTAETLGIAKSDALTAATQFAALGQQAGLTNEELIPFSTSLVDMASNLSSFWNVPTGQALADLKSGLAGQYEPLQKYQMFLTDAVVTTRALADTGKTSAEQLTAGEKAMARYNLISEGMGPAQGDRARTSGEFAGQMRTLQAQLKDTAAVLGMELLPVLTRFADKANELLRAFSDMEPRQKKIVGGLIAFAVVIGPLAFIIGLIATHLVAFGAALGVLIAPLTAVVGILILFAPIIVPLTALFGLLNRVFGVSVSDILRAAQRLWDGISSTVRNVVGKLSELKDKVASTAAAILTSFTDTFESVKTVVGTKLGELYANVVLILTTLKDDALANMYDVGWNIGQGMIDGIAAIWDSVVSFAGDLADAVYNKIKGALDIFSPSGKGEYLGEMLGAGLMRGMENAERGVTSAAGSMAVAALSGMTNYNGGINISVSGAGDPNAVADRVFATFTRELGLRNA